MLPPGLLEYLKQFGFLGVFFLLWYFDRRSFEEMLKNQQDHYESRDEQLRKDLKDNSCRWYELGQRMENHQLKLIGIISEMKVREDEAHSKLDVLLRRGDRNNA